MEKTIEQEFHEWVISNHLAGKFLKEGVSAAKAIPGVFAAFKAGRDSSPFSAKELVVQRAAGYQQCLQKYKDYIKAATKIEKSADLCEDMSMGVYTLPFIYAWNGKKPDKIPGVIEAINKDL